MKLSAEHKQAILDGQREAIAAAEQAVAQELADGTMTAEAADRLLARVDPVRGAERRRRMAVRRKDRNAWQKAQAVKLLGDVEAARDRRH